MEMEQIICSPFFNLPHICNDKTKLAKKNKEMDSDGTRVDQLGVGVGISLCQLNVRIWAHLEI